jgi:hypothetical protein
MAKPQDGQSTRSAVTRLLDPARVAGEFSLDTRSSASTTPDSDSNRPPAEVSSAPYKREISFCEETDVLVRSLIERIHRGTRTRPTTSLMLRSLVRAMSAAWPHIESECRRLGPWALPSNARMHQREREQFEQRLAEAITRAMRTWAEALPAAEPQRDATNRGDGADVTSS